MKVNFVGGAYSDYSTNLNSQICVNMFPVIDNKGGKETYVLYPRPGLLAFGDSTDNKSSRKLYVINGELLEIVGNTLYSVSATGATFTSRGTLSGTTGYVWAADNGTQVMFVDSDNGKGYIYNSSTFDFAQITDADFPEEVTGLAYQNGVFITIKKDTETFYISDVYDGLSWSSLEFASAEGDPDKALTCLSNHLDLWIFGEKTTEVWAPSGNTDFPFRRRTFIETGIGAVGSVAKIENSVYWLSDKNQVVRAPGYRDEVVSTRQVDYHIGTYTTTSDAIGITYTYDGGIFYELTFPSENVTWVFEETTKEWHQRLSYPNNGRHRTNTHVKFGKKHLVGDFETGKIYEMSSTTYTDNSEPIKRIRSSQPIHSDRKFLFLSNFEIEFEAGVGITSGQGSDPEVMLRWSDDGGHTYSNIHTKKIGKTGAYTARARWLKQGKTRNRVYEVSITDPVKFVILGAYVDVVKGFA